MDVHLVSPCYLVVMKLSNLTHFMEHKEYLHQIIRFMHFYEESMHIKQKQMHKILRPRKDNNKSTMSFMCAIECNKIEGV